jgi:hypothetical protein
MNTVTELIQMTSDTEIQVRETWRDARLVLYEDEADITHRCWFSVTEDDRYILFGEVLVDTVGFSENDDSGSRETTAPSGDGVLRQYVDDDQLAVPERVEDALIEYGATDVLVKGDIE